MRPDYTDQQLLALKSINIVMTVLFIVNLAFILHNLFRYIIGLKIWRPLIVIFYAFILITTVLRIIEALVRIFQTETAFFGVKKKFYRLDQEIAMFTVVCIGLILIFTMYQLTLSL